MSDPKSEEKPEIDISQLLQLMPKGSTNAPPSHVSEVAIYASSLLKNLSLSHSTKLTIVQVIFLEISDL
jgi:hypothetical protein